MKRIHEVLVRHANGTVKTYAYPANTLREAQANVQLIAAAAAVRNGLAAPVVVEPAES